MAMERTDFICDPEGYLRHWVVAGPARRPYTGPSGSDDEMRLAAVDPRIVEPPGDAALNAPGPFGQTWRLYQPGANVFVECSSFYSLLEVLDLYAATEVHAPADVLLPARSRACGTADLWVNGAHVLRNDVPRYMYPEAADFTLPLRQGANQLCVRLQALGVRDTRMLFGLQVLEGAAELAIRLPGDPAAAEQLVVAERWLRSVRAPRRDALASEHPAPREARVAKGATIIPWPAGERAVSFDPEGAFSLKVAVDAAGQPLERHLEIPANAPLPQASSLPLVEHRVEHVRHFARDEGPSILHVFARRLLRESREGDAAIVEATLKGIDARHDCSDFTLAALLRMVALGLATEAEKARIRQTALGFRYWDDEPGTDAMCFGSENHSLLFHGCQLLAGRLFPDDRFSNSSRTGREQAALGAQRCAAWLDEVEPNGFREYLSSTYMPLTVAALVNVMDFSGRATLGVQAKRVLDGVFRDLAMHAFDGVAVAPQGRVYRNVLYPHAGGTQALLSYATPEALVARTNWIVFVASSVDYQPPAGLGDLMRQPACRRYRQNGVEVVLHKTSDYLLTSLSIPASFDTGEGAQEVPANWRAALWPGKPGYQQLLWQATLGRDCHVFTNHPGCTFDQSSSRPGYWYGNGTLPRMTQREGMVAQIFDIPESHPVGFTHTHWPSDAFDRQDVRAHWAFGAKGTGALALWCSGSLSPHDEMLTGRELRAWGRRVAWLCLCGRAPDADAFDAFVASCLDLGPAFDTESLTLCLGGRECLRWAD